MTIRHVLVHAVLTALLSGFGSALHAETFHQCVTAVARMDLTAKTAFQSDVRNLVIRQNPSLEKLAKLNMELQIALAQSRRARLAYLLQADPGRISTRGGMSKFSNFSWTQEDTAKLAAVDPSYQVLAEKISDLTARNNGHPDWPNLRRFYAEVMARHPDFTAIMKRLRGHRAKAEERLHGCPPG